MLTSLGQPAIRLRRYGWDTSKEGSLRRKNKKKNKVEEIQLANLAGQEPRKQKSVKVFEELLSIPGSHLKTPTDAEKSKLFQIFREARSEI